MTLTVLTWFWTQPGGRNRYEPGHIAIWAAMVSRHLSIPHRLACVTDEPLDLPSHIEIIRPPEDFRNVRIPSWPEAKPQCLRRLSMFRPDAAAIFGERFVCMDLDAVIAGPLDPLFSGGEDFRICNGTAVGRPYNGSMLLLKAGARPSVFSEFSPGAAALAGRKYVGSDQAWIAAKLPGEATWGEEDGVVFHGLARSADTVPRVMFYPGATKPWMRGHDTWVLEHYRGSGDGKCLILGYGETLWADVAATLDDGPYDTVIASPEAAEHWPGRITVIARDDWEAATLARMFGFGEATWCGRSVEGV